MTWVKDISEFYSLRTRNTRYLWRRSPLPSSDIIHANISFPSDMHLSMQYGQRNHRSLQSLNPYWPSSWCVQYFWTWSALFPTMHMWPRYMISLSSVVGEGCLDEMRWLSYCFQIVSTIAISTSKCILWISHGQDEHPQLGALDANHCHDSPVSASTVITGGIFPCTSHNTPKGLKTEYTKACTSSLSSPSQQAITYNSCSGLRLFQRDFQNLMILLINVALRRSIDTFLSISTRLKFPIKLLHEKEKIYRMKLKTWKPLLGKENSSPAIVICLGLEQTICLWKVGWWFRFVVVSDVKPCYHLNLRTSRQSELIDRET